MAQQEQRPVERELPMSEAVVEAIATEMRADEAVVDLYAEGDVIHAYAACDCGTTYSDRWVVNG